MTDLPTRRPRQASLPQQTVRETSEPPATDGADGTDTDASTDTDAKSESETERAPRVREIEVISWKWVCVAGLVAIVAGFGIGFFSRKYF